MNRQEKCIRDEVQLCANSCISSTLPWLCVGWSFWRNTSSLEDFCDGFCCSHGRISCRHLPWQQRFMLLLGCSRHYPVSMSDAEVGVTHLAPINWTWSLKKEQANKVGEWQPQSPLSNPADVMVDRNAKCRKRSRRCKGTGCAGTCYCPLRPCLAGVGKQMQWDRVLSQVFSGYKSAAGHWAVPHWFIPAVDPAHFILLCHKPGRNAPNLSKCIIGFIERDLNCELG